MADIILLFVTGILGEKGFFCVKEKTDFKKYMPMK